MAKLNLKDATKDLMEGAAGILEQATRVRKGADALYDVLKRMDADLNRKKEEEAARKKQQENTEEEQKELYLEMKNMKLEK